MAAVHEAGHAVIAAHLGVYVFSASVFRTSAKDLVSERSFGGRTAFLRPSDMRRRRMVAVAGLVAELVWQARGPTNEYWGDFLSDVGSMSAADWALAGCEPGEPDDELVEAAEAVDHLLGGRLLPELRAAARALIRDAEVRS